MSVAAGASVAHTLSCCDPLCCPIAPLLGGGCCHARIAPAADLPSVRAWGSVVDSRLASIDNVCRLQERQPFEPRSEERRVGKECGTREGLRSGRDKRETWR